MTRTQALLARALVPPRAAADLWRPWLALAKDIFVWQVGLDDWPAVRDHCVRLGARRIMVSFNRAERFRLARQEPAAPSAVTAVMSARAVRALFPAGLGVEYYATLGGDPAWYRREWALEADDDSTVQEPADSFPEDIPPGVLYWLRFQELFNCLHGLCIDYEPHVAPTFYPDRAPFIDWNNHWFWTDDDNRWQGNPDPATKVALRQRWAAHSLELVANIRAAVDRRAWLGSNPYLAITAPPLALRTVGGGCVDTSGPDGAMATAALDLRPDGTENVYAALCRLPHQTILMAYRSAVRSTLTAARVCLRLQQEAVGLAPVTLAVTNQATPPGSDDPAATGLLNGAFFQSGGGMLRFTLDLAAALAGLTPPIGSTGHLALHQYRGLKHLAASPGVPAVPARPLWLFPDP